MRYGKRPLNCYNGNAVYRCRFVCNRVFEKSKRQEVNNSDLAIKNSDECKISSEFYHPYETQSLKLRFCFMFFEVVSRETRKCLLFWNGYPISPRSEALFVVFAVGNILLLVDRYERRDVGVYHERAIEKHA